ncbi:MAG TPA: homoserine kinase [Burkholderiaceae bacterium]|nr:homoserine kinase [Burkholderiaceae bacterium]
MAVFTALTRDDAAVLLGRYALGTLVDLQGITTGIENTNYFLTTSSGAYVLTLFERLSARDLPFHLDLMRHLARRGLPVPDPIDALDGRMQVQVKAKPATIVTRLPGRAETAPTEAHCVQVGQFLARMHLAAADFPTFQPVPLGVGWWKAIVPRLERHVSDGVFASLAEEVVFQDSFHRSEAYERLPSGPCHADLFRDNVLFDDGRIGGVLDFYFAGCTIWLFDVAVAVNDWCVLDDGVTLEPARTGALLRAYDALRPFEEAERRLWRSVLRAAALRFWISRLHDRHLPRAAHLLQPHDPGRFERMVHDRAHAPEIPWTS